MQLNTELSAQCNEWVPCLGSDRQCTFNREQAMDSLVTPNRDKISQKTFNKSTADTELFETRFRNASEELCSGSIHFKRL